MEIKVPTSWDDVTVNQYQAIRQINKDDYDSDLKFTIAVLQILCELDSIEELPITFITEVSPLIAFLSEPLPTEKHSHVSIDGVSYEWIGSLNELTVGEALSIEQIIDIEELSYEMAYDVVCAVLLREEGKGFNSKLFNENRAKFGGLPITEVIGQILFFLNGGNLYIRDMKTYSIKVSTKKTTQRKNSKLKRLLRKLIKALPFTSGYK